MHSNIANITVQKSRLLLLPTTTTNDDDDNNYNNILTGCPQAECDRP